MSEIKCWTDYPFEELGDEAYKEAPIRPAVITDYDHDKYVTVTVEGIPHPVEIKSGYCYKTKGRIGEVESFNRYDLKQAFPENLK